ncbi:MAG: hypothetical protein QOD24_3035, partial [Solirubrobacteraceae bacterium]|nr:hypothetical protein [Solirubrobacteraceae bacterium]
MHRARWTGLLLAVMAATVLLYAIDVVFEPLTPGVSELFQKFASCAVFFGAAALCVVMGRASRDERSAWWLLALAMALWGAGSVYYSLVLWNVDQVPSPSPADAFWLIFYLPACAALYKLLANRAKSLGRGIWLDALVGGLGVGGAGAVLVLQKVLDHSVGASAATVTNLAYPIGDLGLLALIVAAGTAMGWKASGVWRWIGPAFVIFAVSDSIYLVQVAEDTYATGGLLDLGWPAAALLVGVAAWRREPLVRPSVRTPTTIVVPAVFGFAALGLLVVSEFARVSPLGIGLATASIFVMLARLFLTVKDNRELLAQSRREATTDALTGLGNRRQLTADLTAHLTDLDPERPLMLTLFDLDGFKQYNDRFGHMAGDELLQRLGTRLHAVVDGRGTVYRMGGDEFCALWNLSDVDQASVTAIEAVAALSEHGEAFSIGCSYGSVLLPNETIDPTDALRTADRRMYIRKSGGRPSPEQQISDVLLRALAERDSDLGLHLDGVAGLVCATATRLGVPREGMEAARQTALLHDVGKVAIPDEILHKPGRLDAAEWAFMKRHTIIGERIISAAPALADVARFVRSTHERYDGGGYPDGLAGDEIPLIARIVSVCDAYDAMVTKRAYRDARGTPSALAELRRCSGTQFDPEVVEGFARALDAVGEPGPAEPLFRTAPAGEGLEPAPPREAVSAAFLGGLSAAGLLDRLAEAVTILDSHGVHLHANAAATAILNDLRDRFEAGVLRDLPWGAIGVDGVPLTNDQLPVEVTRLTGENCSDVEVGFPDVAGNVRWLRISARRLSEGEPPYGVVASFTDVTEQRRMSDEIEDAADRYRAVVEALHEGVVLADAEGRIVGGNHRAEEVLGLSPGQMMGTSTNDPRWRAERPDGTQLTGADHPVTRVCASGMPVLGEVIGIHIGALELRWLHVNAMPLRTRDGSLSGVVATFEDVSGQLAEREALRRATELFSTAFADAPIGMALVGLDGGWLQVNERMCEIVGYSADELRARSFQDITYPDDLDADLALLAETVAGKRQGYQMQKRYVRSDGSLIWVLLSVSLVRDPDGTPLHFVSQVQDVTEQRETDQRLQALADRDELTGLLNRRRFEEELT